MCPNREAMIYELDQIGSKKDLTETWEWWQKGKNCRIVISAKSGLNGKLMLNLKNIDIAKGTIFFQPNPVDRTGIKTHGLILNNK